MESLIWGGTLISVIGLVGLFYCILRVVRARRANLSSDTLRAEMSKVVPLNMGALMLSMLGLAVVIVGIFLG
ncbi:hypothetical protein OCH239_05520 [Roseivivax halodurans JCM 10272]|uniref:Uncharacterized protein n=1 Tax=Roseivivax halodurans JCM 10272 TaxID=1449350 RepID=X7EFU2_9RHOB|nr:hypothetical protein [Roseivivax halodurans]ETX14101.1 hypothetical protein OCH239_05520 [Roseivivax halodurans JCM 10272]